MKKLEEIFLKLSLDSGNGLFITNEKLWKSQTSFPNRVKRLIERKIEPDAIFVFDNKPIILFFQNPKDKTELHKEIWNFNECPIAVIIENDEVEIFNGFSIDKETKLLQFLGGEESLSDFSYFELVTGQTWDKYHEQLNYKNRVDYLLLENIKGAREVLLGKNGNRAKLVNAILGKIIFVRYLIDRKVKIKFDGKLRVWTNEEFCQLLEFPDEVQLFFRYLEDKDKGFNGDLFPLSPSEYQQITKQDYGILKNLLLGYDFAFEQPSLFELYDFSIIPIEFISNVYELFIGKDNQKEAGAYYTPLFLVDYILKETVEQKLSDHKPISNKYAYCKVLDPACGSGIFLVETLRKIIEKHIDATEIEIKSEKFKTAIINLAKENIYGIDKDPSAVQVAVFSIYLTLLDYLEPPAIETFKFPILLNSNFFEGDFFDESAVFNQAIGDIDFNFILGNPPWKGNGMDAVGKAYLSRRNKAEKELLKKYQVAVNNNEIAEGFILRASDFTKDSTQIAFIIRSSILYNLGYKKNETSAFRRYVLEEFFIDKVFELAPVRHEVFEKSNRPATAPAAIIFYRHAKGLNTENHIVHHISLKQSRFFSLFKIFTINRSDYKKVQQKKLKEFDWLWKVLVYGSYLDFNFIKRLKESYISIQDVLDDKGRFVYATGIHSASKPLENPKDTSQIKGIPFLKTEAIQSFYINYDGTDELELEKIDRIRDVRIYQAPMLLTRKGLDMDTLTVKNSISKKDILFKDGITSIKSLKDDDVTTLSDVSAIFSSNLFTYYAINTFVSIGIEREQVQNYNKFSLPFLKLESGNQISRIEEIKKQIGFERNAPLIDNISITRLENQIQFELDHINRKIFDAIDVDDTEKSLIHYALEVNRTIITGDDREKQRLFSSLSFNDNGLTEYARLFYDRFSPNLSNEKVKFIVEIWHTKQIVGMFFNISSSSKTLSPKDFPEPDPPNTPI